MSSECLDRLQSGVSADVPLLVLEISHDLREPLRTIHGCATLLARTRNHESDTRTDELLTSLVKAAERMQRLIDDALAFALADCPEHSSCSLDLSEVLQFTLANLQTAINQTQATVTTDPLPKVEANFGALAQVFQNLIGNALKYRSERSPRIHIGCTRNAGEWILSVADNGLGIDPEYHEHIFLPLKRLHGNNQYPGTGFGLAICRRIIESYQGRIWLESQPGAGSTFCFTFPVSKERSSLRTCA